MTYTRTGRALRYWIAMQDPQNAPLDDEDEDELRDALEQTDEAIAALWALGAPDRDDDGIVDSPVKERS